MVQTKPSVESIAAWTNGHGGPSSITQQMDPVEPEVPTLAARRGKSKLPFWHPVADRNHFRRMGGLDEIALLQIWANDPGRNECGHSFPGESGQSWWSFSLKISLTNNQKEETSNFPPLHQVSKNSLSEISQNGLYRFEYIILCN